MFESLSIKTETERDWLRDRTSSDQILTLAKTTWENYESLSIEENSGYRISFLDNEITIVSPSKNHEKVAQIINILVYLYCSKFNGKYFSLGSADIKKEFVAGKQPDCSFCFDKEKDIPDLAVEVNYTSGSIKDLEKYRLLNVPEVWIWQNDTITFYRLEDNQYSKQSKSSNLNNLKSDFLGEYISRGLVEDILAIAEDFSGELKDS